MTSAIAHGACPAGMLVLVVVMQWVAPTGALFWHDVQGGRAMWLLVAREAPPDAPYWPGRHLLAAVDCAGTDGRGGVVRVGPGVAGGTGSVAPRPVGQPPLPVHDLALGARGGRPVAGRIRDEGDAGCLSCGGGSAPFKLSLARGNIATRFQLSVVVAHHADPSALQHVNGWQWGVLRSNVPDRPGASQWRGSTT